MTDTEKRDKLIDKIVKLFRLGDVTRSKTTEGELLAAVTKAKQMMSDHNIAMVEVEGKLDETKANELRIIIKSHSAYTRKGKFAKYDHPIMVAVATLTETKVYIRTQNGYESATFIGDETDIHVASALYMVLLPSLRRFTRQACGTGWSARHTDYAIGFGVRVKQRAKDHVAASKSGHEQSLALVVRKKSDALATYWDGLNLGKPKSSKRRMTSHYLRGYNDGDKMDLGHGRRIKGEA